MNAPQVDLSTGSQGIIGFEGGLRFWCPLIRIKDGEFFVRWESGWYKEYTGDGKSICSGIIRKMDGTEEVVKGKDIIEFIPCGYDDPRASGLPVGWTP